MSENVDVSKQQEEKIAKLFNASRTPRSGGGGFKKGDALSEDWFIECKASVQPKKSYSVSKEILDKADHERAEMQKSYYVLAFELGEEREDFFVLNRKTMSALLDMQTGIKDLIDAVSREIADLDTKYAEMKKATPMTVGNTVQEGLYAAHKAEKVATLEALRKLI